MAALFWAGCNTTAPSPKDFATITVPKPRVQYSEYDVLRQYAKPRFNTKAIPGAQQNINFGTPNDGTGDSLRTLALKTQTNFTELYSNLAIVSNLVNLGGSAVLKVSSNLLDVANSTTALANLGGVKNNNGSATNLTVETQLTVSGTIAADYLGLNNDLAANNGSFSLSIKLAPISESQRDALDVFEGLMVNQSDNDPGIYVYRSGWEKIGSADDRVATNNGTAFGLTTKGILTNSAPIEEYVQTLTASGGAITTSWTNNPLNFRYTLNADTTWNLANTAGTNRTIKLYLYPDGVHLIAWPASVVALTSTNQPFGTNLTTVYLTRLDGTNYLEVGPMPIQTADIANNAVTSAKLSTTGITPGTYGDASNIPQITIDAAGRVTDATTFSNPAASSGFDFGALFGATSDATATPIWTNAVTDLRTVIYHAYVTGAGKTNRGGFQRTATFYRDGGGSTLIASNNLATMQSGSGMDAYFDASGNNVLLKVVGKAGESMNWAAKGFYQVITNGAATVSSASATDTFNRTDANPMSTTASDGVSTWVSGPGGLGDVKIVSNELVDASGGFDGAMITSPTFAANQYSEVTIGSIAAALAGPGVRMQGSGDCRGYFIYIADVSQLQLYKVTDNTAGIFQLGANFSTSVTTGDVVRLEITGTTLTVKVNGASLGTRTDFDYATGQPWVFVNATGKIDKFQAGDLP